MEAFACRRTGRIYTIGEPLDHDGQALVHAVEPASSGLALKRYRPDTLQRRPELESRIRAMLARPPAYRAGPSGAVAVAWPEDAAYVADRFVGFVMPRVDTGEARRVTDVATAPDLTWGDRVAVAENLAAAVAVLHDAGVVVGDVREHNVLAWRDGRVTLFGSDRMQVEDPASGRHFPCVADRNACTPPEQPPLSSALRTRSGDIFPLAVLLHVVLLAGAHPFRGEWRGPGDRPTEHELARAGLWSYAGDLRLGPDRGAPPPDVLPDALRRCFRAAFVDGASRPGDRPPAAEWRDALADLRRSLVACPRDPTHVHGAHLGHCPWCGTDARPASAPPGYLQGRVTTAPSGSVPAGAAPPATRPADAGPVATRPSAGRPVVTLPAARPAGPLDTVPARHPDATTPDTTPDTTPARRSGGRLRAATWAAAWAVAAVAGLGVLAGVAGAPGGSPSAVTDSAATVPASAPSSVPPARPADPTAALEWVRGQDAATVETLAETWVAQLATRPAGAEAPDRAKADAAVLAGHDALRGQHPGAVLLWSEDWNYDGRAWITVVATPFARAEEANAWCDRQRLAGPECFAKRLSRSGDVAGSARYRE